MEGGHPDPEIGGDRSQKKFFRSFGPQFGLKIWRLPPLAPPLVGACSSLVISFDKQLPKTAEH